VHSTGCPVRSAKTLIRRDGQSPLPPAVTQGG
jgi:hypothetical protein